MHQNLAIILQQFNYSKNNFLVLVPVNLPNTHEQNFVYLYQVPVDLANAIV